MKIILYNIFDNTTVFYDFERKPNQLKETSKFFNFNHFSHNKQKFIICKAKKYI